MLPSKEDVIRIDCIEKPLLFEKGEGCYEWRHMQDKYYIDMFLLIEEVEKIIPNRGLVICDLLMNFPRIFINKKTGEVITSTIPEGSL